MSFTGVDELLADSTPVIGQMNSTFSVDPTTNQALKMLDPSSNRAHGHTGIVELPRATTHEPHTIASYPLNSPTTDNSEAWSAAIGPAASAGKSGRVIERLMGDVDRLRRELKLATAKYEEEQRRSESARETLGSLQNKMANLEVICGTTEAALTRRDRRIEDFRAALETEKSLRKKAETEKRELSLAAEKTKDVCEKDLVRQKELALYASTQYDILKNAFQDAQNDYHDRFTKLRGDILTLEQQRQEDQQRFEALDAICAELRVDHDKSGYLNQSILDGYETYKNAREDAISPIVKKAEMDALLSDKVFQEVTDITGQMRYIMNLKKTLKD